MRAGSIYHKTLRVSGLIVGLVLLADSGIISGHTELLSLRTRQYIASAIGVSANVEPTAFNEITAALTARERELAEREAALREREIDARAEDTSGAIDYSSYILSALLFVILVLIIMNYIFDFVRARRQTATLTYADTV